MNALSVLASFYLAPPLSVAIILACINRDFLTSKLETGLLNVYAMGLTRSTLPNARS